VSLRSVIALFAQVSRLACEGESLAGGVHAALHLLKFLHLFFPSFYGMQNHQKLNLFIGRIYNLLQFSIESIEI